MAERVIKTAVYNGKTKEWTPADAKGQISKVELISFMIKTPEDMNDGENFEKKSNNMAMLFGQAVKYLAQKDSTYFDYWRNKTCKRFGEQLSFLMTRDEKELKISALKEKAELHKEKNRTFSTYSNNDTGKNDGFLIDSGNDNQPYFVLTESNSGDKVKYIREFCDQFDVEWTVKYIDDGKLNDTDDSTIQRDSANDSQVFVQIQTLIDNGIAQIVLTGAPGTGKTYISNQIVLQSIQDNTLYSQYVKWSKTPKACPITEVSFKSFKKCVTALLSDSSYYRELSFDSFFEYLDEGEQKAGEQERLALLRGIYEKDDVSQMQEAFKRDAETIRGTMAFVQFHPSYDYTDFVEGFRPVELSSGMAFKRMDGTFMSFCRYVAWRNEVYGENKQYFFLIDEINRADLSKVLGELMFSLEGDKRGPSNPVKTQYHSPNLRTYLLDGDGALLEGKEKRERGYVDCFRSGFYIPKNVVVIGTMNDIDRSVESMDFALRRRFNWVDVAVDRGLLSQAFDDGEFFDKQMDVVRPLEECQDDAARAEHQEQEQARKTLMKESRDLVIARLLTFNKAMRDYGLTAEYDIAHGHFTNLPSLSEEDERLPLDTPAVKFAQAILKKVWDYRIKSLMNEYLRGHNDLTSAIETLEKCWNAPIPPAPTDGGTQA